MEIIYWNNKVEKLINDLDQITASRVIRSVDLLEEQRHLLDMPDSKSLRAHPPSRGTLPGKLYF